MAPEIKEFKTLVNRAIKPIDTIAEMQYVEKALEKGIAILSADKPAYELCWRLHELLGI